MTVSEYLLKAGLGKQVNARLTVEEVSIFRELTAQGNNLNQIAKGVNQTGLLSTSDIEDLMKIKELIKRLL
ncbi:plasmid mobilization relaxosome protein MobC [Ekhidna sp.]